MTPQDEQEKTPPNTRTVVVLGGLAVTAVGALAVFAAGGWIGVAAVAAGAATTGHVAHRYRHPKTRPGVLGTLLARPRRSKTGSKLTWPFTGSQAGRASRRSGSAGSGKRSGTSSSRRIGRSTTGMKLPKLKTPGSSRIGSAKPGGRRKVTGGTSVRPVKRTTSPRLTSSSKPSGTRPPKTGSRTGTKPRLSAVKRPTGGPRSTSSGKGIPRLSATKRSSTPTKRPASRPSGRIAPARRGGPGKFLPRLGSGNLISGSRKLGSKRTGKAGRLGTRRGLGAPRKRAGRLGTPKIKSTPNKSPSRSIRRLKPYRRATARGLIRTGLGLPGRTGRRLALPTKTQRKRARRTLKLRSLTRLWAIRKLPTWSFRIWWDRTWAKLPQQPLPEWTLPTITPKAIAVAGPRYAVPVPAPQPKEIPKVTAPLEAASDAFAQLANFTPETPEQMEMFLQDLGTMMEQWSGSLTTLADRMGTEMPFAQAVGDTVRDLGAGILALHGAAATSAQTLRQEHDADFARRENPRPGEQLWNPDNT